MVSWWNKNNFYLPVGNGYIKNYKEKSNEEELIDTTFKLHHIKSS